MVSIFVTEDRDDPILHEKEYKVEVEAMVAPKGRIGCTQ